MFCTDSTGLHNSAQNIRMANNSYEMMVIMREIIKYNEVEINGMKQLNKQLNTQIRNERITFLVVLVVITSIAIIK
jgi:hypothetical protein